MFVLFQENRSFDHYFGTYPGANGLVAPSRAPADRSVAGPNQTASYTQNIRYTDGSYQTVTPFLAPRTIQDVNGATIQLYPESIYSVDHSHTGYIGDLHSRCRQPLVTKNDGYALDQEGLEYATDASTPTAMS